MIFNEREIKMGVTITNHNFNSSILHMEDMVFMTSVLESNDAHHDMSNVTHVILRLVVLLMTILVLGTIMLTRLSNCFIITTHRVIRFILLC